MERYIRVKNKTVVIGNLSDSFHTLDADISVYHLHPPVVSPFPWGPQHGLLVT